MSLDTIFALEVVLMMVLLAAAAGGAIYLAVSNRRARRETDREVSIANIPANIPVGTALEEYAEDTIERAAPREPRREF